MYWIPYLMQTQAPKSTLLIRLMMAGIFTSEGIQKFIYPEALGIGRFIRIGIPFPDFTATCVGTVEIVGGFLILVGFLTRPAALSLFINMLFAVWLTKIPFLIAHGFWATAHEARTDYAMLLGTTFLLLVGAGPWSIDGHLTKPMSHHKV